MVQCSVLLRYADGSHVRASGDHQKGTGAAAVQDKVTEKNNKGSNAAKAAGSSGVKQQKGSCSASEINGKAAKKVHKAGAAAVVKTEQHDDEASDGTVIDTLRGLLQNTGWVSGHPLDSSGGVWFVC